MRRFLPRSLIGQIALVMAAALLAAQAINFTILFAERQRSSHTQIEVPAMSRFVGLVQRLAATPAPGRAALLAERTRRGHITIGAESGIAAGASDPTLVARLREQAEQNGVVLRDARAAMRDEVELTPELRARLDPDELAHAQERTQRMQTLLL